MLLLKSESDLGLRRLTGNCDEGMVSLLGFVTQSSSSRTWEEDCVTSPKEADGGLKVRPLLQMKTGPD